MIASTTSDELEYSAFITDTLLWTNKVRSAFYFISGLMAWFVVRAIFVSPITLFIGVCFILFSLAFYFLRGALAPRYQERCNWADSAITQLLSSMLSGAVHAAASLHDLHLHGLDPLHTLEVGLGLWVLSVLGRALDAVTLLLLLHLGAFTLPLAYKVYKKRIDFIAADIYGKIYAKYEKFNRRIRFALVLGPLAIVFVMLPNVDRFAAIVICLAYGRSLAKPDECSPPAPNLRQQQQQKAPPLEMQGASSAGRFMAGRQFVESRSNQLRAAANIMYQTLDGLEPCFITNKISQIEGLYSNALKAATTPLERCSTAKNLAVLAKRTLRLTRADGPTALNLQVSALKHYVTALVWGSECQTIAWSYDVFSAATELVDTALSWVHSELVRERPFLAQDWPDQELVLSRLHAALPLDSSSSERSGHVAALKATLSLSYAKHLYAEAVGIQDSGSKEQEWRRALYLVGRVQPLLTVAAHSATRAGDEELREEANTLLGASYICEAICRSCQARHTGDAMLKRVLEESGVLDEAELRLVADFYRKAVSHASGLDVESAARAHRALGNLYYNVLRMTDRGLEHYKMVVEMGVAMMPRVVSNTVWYQEARQTMLKAEQEKQLEQLAPELEALRKAVDQGAHVLVKHVYDTHPPPDLAASFILTPDMLLGDKIKDTLRKAVIAYHPDKQVGKPAKWCVLAAEISKELNCTYQCMK